MSAECSSGGGAELKGADLRAADLTGADLSHLQSIAGADFSLVKGLSQSDRAHIASFPAQELSTWNAYTRRNTKDSLGLT